jgi:hypothetical protein
VEFVDNWIAGAIAFSANRPNPMMPNRTFPGAIVMGK